MSTDAPTAGPGPAETAQEKVQDLAGQAQEKAQELTGQAKGRLREQVDQRTSQAASQVGQQASDLRTVGQTLREQGKENPARAADTVAQYAEQVGGYLENNDAETLLADLEDFGRRRPWAVGLGGLALGFAASRFLKASSSRRYSARNGSPPAPPRSDIPDTGGPRSASAVTEPLGPPVTAPVPPAPLGAPAGVPTAGGPAAAPPGEPTAGEPATAPPGGPAPGGLRPAADGR